MSLLILPSADLRAQEQDVTLTKEQVKKLNRAVRNQNERITRRVEKGLPIETLELTDERSDQIAGLLGMKPDSKAFTALMRQNSMANREEELAGLEIVGHFRGNDGINIPRRSLYHYVNPQLDGASQRLLDQYVNEITAEEEVAYKEDRKGERHPYIFPKCKESKTEVTRVGVKDHLREAVLQDRLYIKQGDVPMDPASIFGLTVQVVPVSIKDAPETHYVHGHGIECLPTRIRYTTNFAFRHEGRDAVKNYDGDPRGKGEIHPSMEKRY